MYFHCCTTRCKSAEAQRELPDRLQQRTIQHLLVRGHKWQSLSSRGRGDDPVGWVIGELVRKLRGHYRDFRGDWFDGHVLDKFLDGAFEPSAQRNFPTSDKASELHDGNYGDSNTMGTLRSSDG